MPAFSPPTIASRLRTHKSGFAIFREKRKSSLDHGHRNSNGQSYFENGISTDDLRSRPFSSPSQGKGNSHNRAVPRILWDIPVPPAGCIRTRRKTFLRRVR
ncbi:MAG: hypothetical protein LBC30_04805 [Puniceicoccales bacterium]|nr:hypothetical protein [Puniceicoccales bacterium]